MASPEMPNSPSAFPASNDYDIIGQTSFDLIIFGTGLPQSLLAAAASTAAKSVVHIDPNSFYGSHFSSIPLPSFHSFLSNPVPLPFIPSSSSSSSPSSSYTPTLLQLHNLYTHIETSGSLPEPSKSFTIDINGPRLLYCADDTVDLLVRSSAHHHVAFKSIESNLVYWENKLFSVPDSRQAIFKDKTLGLAEKSQMMKFLKVVQSHIESNCTAISEEDLELPFVEFLKKQKLPPKIRAIVLYAIAMADDDQDQVESSNKLVTTKEGIERIFLYTSSMGRFAGTVGAFIYPMYGHGELSQAFCRCAAVKGALYVLRMPLAALLTDKENEKYAGVRLASGEDIYSPNLVLDPSYKYPPSEITNTPPSYVARGVCITSRSVQFGSSNALLVFPPKCLNEEQSTAIRAVQLSSNVGVCPSGLFVVHFSTPCKDPVSGKEKINSAINALFDNADSSEESTNIEMEKRPTLLWSCVFVQQLLQAFSDEVSVCPMPDENLDYRNMLNTTRKLFEKMYPDEEFLPQNSVANDNDDDDNNYL